MTWDELRQNCLACSRCPLAGMRHHVVFGVGPEDAEVLFVGEGPGQQEDLQGEPFVGPAGQLLDEMLSIIGLGRHNCYITNIVKCRPPGTGTPRSRAGRVYPLPPAADQAAAAEDHRLSGPNRRQAAD